MAPAPERFAPVQGYSAGIPWSMHLRAYDAYCKEHGKQQALIEGHCRGGFGVNELDMFIPGWREELSELHQLRTKLAAVEAERDARAPDVSPDQANELADVLRCTRSGRAFVKSAQDLRALWENVSTQRDKLAVFKKWVHDYLDTHGIPHHPPGTHGAAGCRIGDRMDWLMEKLRAAEAQAQDLVAARIAALPPV